MSTSDLKLFLECACMNDESNSPARIGTWYFLAHSLKRKLMEIVVLACAIHRLYLNAFLFFLSLRQRFQPAVPVVASYLWLESFTCYFQASTCYLLLKYRFTCKLQSGFLLFGPALSCRFRGEPYFPVSLSVCPLYLLCQGAYLGLLVSCSYQKCCLCAQYYSKCKAYVTVPYQPQERAAYHVHCVSEETETQREKTACPRTPGWSIRLKTKAKHGNCVLLLSYMAQREIAGFSQSWEKRSSAINCIKGSWVKESSLYLTKI